MGAVAGCHLGLLLDLQHFHVDDSGETLTAGGTFSDHEPKGHTRSGADLMATRTTSTTGSAACSPTPCAPPCSPSGSGAWWAGSCMPGCRLHADRLDPKAYVREVVAGHVEDPVLTAHLHGGWQAAIAILGDLPHDGESRGWAAVIQWCNPAVAVPPGTGWGGSSGRPA
ncbi:MAG: hypothetical protein RL148_2475 [Planctomycetota bacterium]